MLNMVSLCGGSCPNENLTFCLFVCDGGMWLFCLFCLGFLLFFL